MLEWDIESSPNGGDSTRIRLRGAIDERTRLEDIPLGGDPLVLIADGIRYINSTGLRRLWAFVEPIAQRRPIAVERCSPALVGQLNLTPALAESLTVRSIIAPLECTECVAETDVLLPVPERGVPAVPARRCEICGAEMVLAELEERYFAFLR